VQGVRPVKRRRTLTDLGDDYANWTPVPDDDGGDLHAVADTVTSFETTLDEDTAKRKRYASSVSYLCNLGLGTHHTYRSTQ
jgi:hypothetical protein